MREIHNGMDIIDSRDIIKRLAELESEIEGEEINEDNGAEPQYDDAGNAKVVEATCGECGKTWNDALISSRTPAPSGRCPYEDIHDEIAEFKILKAFAEEAEGSPDWIYGETLIRDSYFETYAQELAEDIGAINKNEGWPARCIDWKQAAEELQQDYMSAEFDGVTYWIRA